MVLRITDFLVIGEFAAVLSGVDSEIANSIAVGAVEANSDIFTLSEFSARDSGFGCFEKRSVRIGFELGFSHRCID